MLLPKLGRRARYLTAFLTGLSFVAIEAILIAIELSLSLAIDFNDDLILIVEGFVIWILVLGIIEGFFTAIASSYYSRVINQEDWDIPDEADLEEESEDDDIDPILFFDEEE